MKQKDNNNGLPSSPHELWGIKEIADYYKIKPISVSSKYLKAPGFPQSFRVNLGVGYSKPLWKAAEIIEWTEKQR